MAIKGKISKATIGKLKYTNGGLFFGHLNGICILVIAGSSKVIFILLVLSSNESYMGFGAGTAVIADSIMVGLYIVYLLLTGKRGR